MKKSLLFILSLVFIGATMAQTQRLVLVEEFTNASCGPCASLNPAFNNLLESNLDIAVSIKYQTSWPGYDPMYNDNPSEPGARVGYYSVNGVPDASVNGGNTTSPSSVTQSTLDNASEVPSYVEIMMNHEVVDGNINVTMLIHALEGFSGMQVAHIAILEEIIEFSSAPGSNGEKVFENVMKKMLPGSGGSGLPDMEAGDYYIIQQSYAVEDINFYEEDLSEMRIIGWIQDNDSKDVLQAARSSEDAIVPLYSFDAEVISPSNVYTNYCVNDIEPGVIVRNNGGENITSLEISYNLNDEEAIVETWNGTIEPFTSTEIMLSATTFDILANNALNIEVLSVNGSTDEYPSNNIHVYEFESSPLVNEVGFNLFLKLDENPEETTWEIINETGTVFYSGGPYTTAGQIIQESFELDVFGCYQFVIYDSGNDGVCCDSGYGLFQLKDDDNQVLGQSEIFSDELAINFRYDTDISIDDNFNNISFNVYPNPASDAVSIVLDNMNANVEKVSIYSAYGQLVENLNADELSNTNAISVDVTNYTNGMYFVEIIVSGKKKMQKLIIKK